MKVKFWNCVVLYVVFKVVVTLVNLNGYPDIGDMIKYIVTKNE